MSISSSLGVPFSFLPRRPRCSESESCWTSTPIYRWTLRTGRLSRWPRSSTARPCLRPTERTSLSIDSRAEGPFVFSRTIEDPQTLVSMPPQKYLRWQIGSRKSEEYPARLKRFAKPATMRRFRNGHDTASAIKRTRANRTRRIFAALAASVPRVHRLLLRNCVVFRANSANATV